MNEHYCRFVARSKFAIENIVSIIPLGSQSSFLALGNPIVPFVHEIWMPNPGWLLNAFFLISLMLMRIVSDPEIVIAVVDAGSFRRAGLEIGLSQSNVSRRIKDIERRIGQDLFSRSGRAASLTKAGQAYIVEARKATIAMKAAETSARQFAGEVGLFTITAPVSFGKKLVAPALAEYANRKGNVQLHLDLSDQLRDPSPYDLIVRAGPASRNDLIGRVLFRSQLKLVASTHLARDLEAFHTLEDMNTCPTIGIRDTHNRFDWPFRDHRGQKRIVTIRPTHLVSDVDAALQFCRAGLGITVLPDWCVNLDLSTGELVEVLPNFVAPNYPISVYSKSRSALKTRLSGLVEAMEQRLGQLKTEARQSTRGR